MLFDRREYPRGLISTVHSDRVEILGRLEEKSMNLNFDLAGSELAHAQNFATLLRLPCIGIARILPGWVPRSFSFVFLSQW